MTVASKYYPSAGGLSRYRDILQLEKHVFRPAITTSVVPLSTKMAQDTAIDGGRVAFETKNTNDLWMALYRVPDGESPGDIASDLSDDLENYRLTEYVQVGGSAAAAIETTHSLTMVTDENGNEPAVGKDERLYMCFLTRSTDAGADSSSTADDTLVYALGNPTQLAGLVLEHGHRPIV